jgi:hypothetical protein
MLRTVEAFVEDLLSNGKSARYIIIIAENTHWKTRLLEVKEVLLGFSGKLSENFIAFS